MRMLVPHDLEAKAAALVGVPFRPKGVDPKGWDCQGCARWCLTILCGVAVPDYGALYEAAIVSPRGLNDRARLLADGLAQWRPVEPQAGVVAWLEWLGRPGHVGFMLSPTRVLHADSGCGTVVMDLMEPAAGYRLKGAFVPRHIEIIERTWA